MQQLRCFLKDGAAAISILLILLTGSTASIGQTYAKMRITTNQGTLIEGKKGSVGNDAAVLTVDDSQKSVPLSEIQFITTKKGSAFKWCLGFGGGCLAIGLATTAVNPNGDDSGMLLLGSAIWAGIFGGVGALIGLATDPWETVYYGRRQESVSRFKFKLDTDYMGKPMLGLSYSF